MSGLHNMAPFCLPQKSSFLPRSRMLTHTLSRLQTQGLVLQSEGWRSYVHFQGQDEAELAGFREYVEMFAGTKADCLPETIWKDLTRGQGFGDEKELKWTGRLKEIQRKGWEIRELERTLDWMERVAREEKEKEKEREKEMEREREREREKEGQREKCGTGQKRWFSTLGGAFRWSPQLEEEEALEVLQVSRVTANANGESKSKLMCATHGSSDDSTPATVGQLEKGWQLVGVGIEDCETTTRSEVDGIQNWIKGVTDTTAKPTVWIPPTPYSPLSPSVYSQDQMTEDSIDITDVYAEDRRPYFVKKNPKGPNPSVSESSAYDGDEELPILTHSVRDLCSAPIQSGWVVMARKENERMETLDLIRSAASQQWHGNRVISDSNSSRQSQFMPSFIDSSKAELSYNEDRFYDTKDDCLGSEMTYEALDEYSDSEAIRSGAPQQLPMSLPRGYCQEEDLFLPL